MSKHFDPPYDSPLEESFAWSMSKVISPNMTVEKQLSVPTQFATFRLDLLVSGGERRVGIELDGAEFHKDKHTEDYTRDALILYEGACDVIYRIEGKDAYHRPYACLKLIAEEDSSLFSERGWTLLMRLAEEERRNLTVSMFPTPFIHNRSLLRCRDIQEFLRLVESRKCKTLEQAQRLAFAPARTFGETT